MKIYKPKYYKQFKCLTSNCPDTCCALWEVPVDNKSYNFYKNLNTAFGEKIISNIVKDDDGDNCFKNINNKCPFLNKNNLCDIHIALGENHTTEVCQEYPKFTEEYDSFTEISLSFSCPACAKIIINRDNNASDYLVPFYNGNDMLLYQLIKSRANLLSNKYPVIDYINEILRKAVLDSNLMDLYFNSKLKEISILEIKKFLNYYLNNCEILTNDWKNYLSTAISSNLSMKDFMKYLNKFDTQIRNILYYYVYRYYLKAINDLNILSKAQFISFSVLTSVFVACVNNITLQRAAQLYSKETEHSTDNVNILYDYFDF